MKKTKKQSRKLRVRLKIKETKLKPRLSIFRSNKFIYAQIIDDNKGKTLIGVSDKNLKTEKKLSKMDKSKELGIILAEKAIAQKIKEVVFDRGPYKYHGRVKAIAEGAREGGLKF